MKIEDNRTTLKANTTDRRNSPASEAQRFSSMENFTIFMLRGMQSHIRNPRALKVLSPSAVDAIHNIAEGEIQRIKKEQEMRKEKK